MKKYFWLLYLLFSTVVYAGTIDPKTEDAKYIDYGSKFHCVYKISGTYINDEPYAASCVVIKPDWVITAAHVVEKSKISFVYQEKDKTYLIDKVICHELYKSHLYGYHDIALCHIKNNIVLNFYPKLYDKKDEIGKICSISGYGLTGTFETGISKSDNHRRAGSNIIDSIDRKLLICTPSRAGKTELEFLIAVGDSGGGLFIDNKLAGINSCVMSTDGTTNSSYTNESGHTRISEYHGWINKTIEENNNEK